MKIGLVYLVSLLSLTACSESEFSQAVTKASEASGDATSGKDATSGEQVAAEGMDYAGDPIVLKDPPPAGYALYGKISSSWKTRVVTTAPAKRHPLQGKTLSTELTIADFGATRQNVQSVSQISRLRRPAFIRQQPGQNSSTASENLRQENRGVLDILLVMDNTGSMVRWIGGVKDSISDLLTHISGSNWQFSMVRSQPSHTCLVEGRVTSKTANYEKVIRQLLPTERQMMGNDEHLLKKARWALEGKSGTQCDGNWLRQGAKVAVIIIGDEPHKCPDHSFCSASAYRNFINNFSHDIKNYGITRGWSHTDRSIFTEHGAIDAPPYTATLRRISDNIQTNLEDIFTLTHTPDGTSMTVEVNDVAVSSCNTRLTSNCYKVVSAAGRSAVQFVGYEPPANARINIDYTYGRIPFDTEWTLPHDPLPQSDTVTVTKNNTSTTLVRGTDYTINGRVLRVTSQSLVPQGSSIRVDYLEDKALQTAFTLDDDTGRLNVDGARLVPDSVKVVIGDGDGNDLKTLTSGFSFDGTTLTFTNATVPAAGIVGEERAQTFRVAYDYRYGKQLSYAFAEHANRYPNSEVRCHNETQDHAVDCTSDSATINFSDATRVSVGDVIVINEELLNPGNISLAGTGWIADEAVGLALPNTGSCTVPPRLIVNDEVVLEDLSVSDCPLLRHLDPNERQIHYDYKVYAPEAQDFLLMDKTKFEKQRGKYKFEYWEIMINGTRTNKFTINKYRITLAEEVEIGKNTTVSVTVKLYHAL